MTEKEFYLLKCGTVVSERFHPCEYYVIDCEDEFGNGYRDKECMVFRATEMEPIIKFGYQNQMHNFGKQRGR